MKIAFLMNAFDRTNLIKYPKNVGYFMIKHLKRNGADVEVIPPIPMSIISKLPYKIKEITYNYVLNKRYIRCCEFNLLKHDAKIISDTINKINADFIFSFGPFASVFLETDKKIAFWTDAMLKGLLNTYPEYTNLCKESINNNFLIDRLGVEKSDAVFFTSDWARNLAIDVFPNNANNYTIAPFGANVDINNDYALIENITKERLQYQICKLLLVGMDWQRKGVDKAVAITTRLNELGLKSEITIIGCQPPKNTVLPNFVKNIKFIDTSVDTGLNTMFNYYGQSHFFLMPTLAETFGHVFCEANAFGLPCISHKTGGVPSVITNEINGHLFEIGENIDNWCEYIIKIFNDKTAYKELCLTSFNEYQTRLNWDNGCKIVIDKLKKSM